MRRSTSGRILTTHVGALPGPDELWEGVDAPEAALHAAVRDVVALQTGAGIDIVNEGELTKGGNWVTFLNARLSGFTQDEGAGTSYRLLTRSEDWKQFGDFYRAAQAGGTLFEQTRTAPKQQGGVRDWVCTAPIRYTGQASLEREIGALRQALGDRDPGDAFLTSTAPASVEVGRRNAYYASEEAFLFALAEALGEEYRAIVAAGFLLQVDDAWLAALWDRIGVTMGLAAYRRYCMVRVEALNHALKGIPPEKVRYHLCWGSWHGPHAHDIPLGEIVDVMLAVNAGAYLFEAANARHEHEYRIWDEVTLPEGKILAPGVVSHATAIVEHPELVAERIHRFASRVGAENVIASTDCGLGLRCHPQIAWAKLDALSRGAALAGARLRGTVAA
jgi:5-methyltetrahydropteroyltriglutamate--homocysteine methyltransferase